MATSARPTPTSGQLNQRTRHSLSTLRSVSDLAGGGGAAGSHDSAPNSQTISARHLQHAASSAHQLKGHQRRQSVARLLPDISKLRLLSWLVEASSELINCDIAIMDGVYAKLNRSQESLLFWGAHPAHKSHRPAPPAPPTLQPVPNSLLISQHLKQQRQRAKEVRHQAGRNHHSLPIAHYDASSLAAQLEPSANRLKSSKKDSPRKPARPTPARSASLPSGAPPSAGHTCPSEANQSSDDDLQAPAEDNDDANSSASSNSTSSSGIHGGISLSSSASSSSSSGCSGSSSASHLAASSQPREQVKAPSLSEQLSEKIRRALIEHNRLQSLLVNIIRQHDRQRELERRRLQQNSLKSSQGAAPASRYQHSLRIDLTNIVSALDDGCFCSCHSQRRSSLLESPETGSLVSGLSSDDKCSTLPIVRSRSLDRARLASLVRQQLKQQQKMQQRLNKANSNLTDKLWSSEPKHWEISNNYRKEMIHLLSDKLCEDCFEAHYWLHGASLQADELFGDTHGSLLALDLELAADELASGQVSGRSGNCKPLPVEQLNALIGRRNGILVKLVQQEVRSIISKSIDLIDLIRREIKSPEYIKQKQLMKCFSSSIQLLTSVSNYVVPTQDISSFIPDNMINQQQTNLFKLPSNDFDYLLLSSSSSSAPFLSSSNNSPTNDYQDRSSSGVGLQQQNRSQQQQDQAYHLALAPEIPIRLTRVNNLLNPGSRRILSRAGSCYSQDSSTKAGSLSSLPASLNRPSQISTTTTSLATADRQTDNGSAQEQQQQPTTASLDEPSSEADQHQAISDRPPTTETNLISDVKPTMQVADNGSRATFVSPAVLLTDNSATKIAPMSTSGLIPAESSSSGASSNNSSASSSIARGTVQQSSMTRSVNLAGSPNTVGSSLKSVAGAVKLSKPGGSLRHDTNKLADAHRSDLSSLEAIANLSVRQKTDDDDMLLQSRGKFWKSNKFNFIKKLLHVKQQRLLRQQSKDRRIYNSKVQSKFRLVMMDLTHFNKSQQLLATENGVNSLLTSMRNVLEFGLYLTLKLY